jgi:hypothetical protein
MSKFISTSAVVLALFLSGHISAQEQAPQTTADFLTQHHVEDSPPGLRAALSNPDPAVRGVAAGLLAQKMDTKSIPFLETARVREPRIDIQVTLAGALNELGDGVGHSWLVNKCNQANAAAVARMLAANKLLETHSDDCLGPVLDMLGGGTWPRRHVARTAVFAEVQNTTGQLPQRAENQAGSHAKRLNTGRSLECEQNFGCHWRFGLDNTDAKGHPGGN